VDLAIGNGIGSVTANLGLIMGLSLVCMPSVMKRGSFAIKGILMTVAALGILLCSRTGTLLMPGVVLLVVLFVFYLVENVQQARLSREEENELSAPVSRDRATVLVNAAKFVFGAAGIVIGANLLVDNGSELALVIGVPEGVIAASMVAIGTSLPELVTTITAIAKKQANLSIGNILGANIIDLTVILPLSTLLSGQTLTVSQQSLVLDFPFCLLVCLVAIVPTLIRQRTSRLQGVVLLLIYGVYLYLLCFAGV
jgi:cation:H+ antiporter